MSGERSEPRPLRTDLSPVAEAVAEADAAGFVAVGDRLDDDLRYLTRVSGPDRTYGVVVTPESASSPPRAVLLATPSVVGSAERRFVDAARIDAARDGSARSDPAAFHDGVVRAVRTGRAGDPIGVRAAAVLDERGSAPDDDVGRDDGLARDDARRVLVPRTVPHDAAVYLERAGYDPTSTPVVTDSRAVKTPAEVDRIRRIQRVAAAGMARAEAILARSGPVDPSGVDGDERPVLRWEGDPLTTERLRRAVNATVAELGAGDAGHTVVAAGRTAADRDGDGGSVRAPVTLGVDRAAPIRSGETVVVELAPRGPDGYHGALTRTFVVDGDGGWARRAYVAVESAREAALAEVESGAPTATVHGEAAAELAAYGFDPNASPGEPGYTHDTGHGVGLSRREPPALPGGTDLRPGHVLAVEPGVYDPEIGGVRLGDLVVVRENGHEVLVEYPFGTSPTDRGEFDGLRHDR
ncbi:Xaa-Pro aminopeptidase [Halorubrum aquaticum]|uniref:Xaa-Pro aminopeptidase n=1 Tax=Halorubrum aquaticum TaxID=387340 RepID=A0A1I3ARL0_9EURY|nr:M24 family metallopeptidase [Halorubrum aquaticum]SFH52663.1 Xaa-Pro aminopeptidase [Halorubrum aquaticum]